MKHKHAFQYRFYPTDTQKNTLARTFGCCRVVYNWALRERTDAYYQRNVRLYYQESSARLTQLKKQPEYSWLNEVSSVPLQQELRHLEKAFVNFFEGRAEYPKFHKKHGKQSATYMSTAFSWDVVTLTLAKMDEPLTIRWSRPLPASCKPSSIIVSQDGAGRYFVSFLLTQEMEPLPVVARSIGADLGIKSFVVLSSGETIGNPQFFRNDEKRLAHAQRRHARRKKGSKNKEKARVKVAKVHARIADRRRDFGHQLSTRMIRENQVICVESLAVKNMVKNHCLAKSISDVGWGEFVRQLEYKAAWYGRTLVKIDRWYPSSKRCFDCGYIHETLDLSERVWTCPECHTHHDRDLNAADTVHAAGLAVISLFRPPTNCRSSSAQAVGKEDACGESVRPGAVKTNPGCSRRSRKASQ